MLLRFILLIAFCFAVPAFAEDVRLSDPDGRPIIEGTLVSRDGELFRIETAAGVVTIDAGLLICSGRGCPDPDEMIARATIGGASDLIHRLFPALLEIFAESQGLQPVRMFLDDTDVSWELREPSSNRLVSVFRVEELGSGAVPDALLADQIDLGLTMRDAGSTLRQDVVALDAIVPAVAPDNPRAMVTLAQLQMLLSGAQPTWERLGGTAEPVVVHLDRAREDQVRKLGVDAVSARVVRHDSLEDLADSVSADPAALGLVPYSSLGNTVPLIVSGACGLATPATRDTIRAEDYPMTQPVFLQRVGADHSKVLREFIAFARDDRSQPVIRASGFIDQAIGRISFERQGNRIANAVLMAGQDPDEIAEVQAMIATLLNGERLTLTFRFRDGSSELDSQSVSNIQRLADAISNGAFADYEVKFVGFSDGIGDKDANLRLSERRARAVRQAVSARLSGAEATLTVEAFGELMPMACDDALWGGQVNRRVEVWLKPLEVAR